MYPTLPGEFTSASERLESLPEEYERKLIKGCIEWDREAQNGLYRLFASKMFALCFQYSRSREEAEDTLHEGFMKVFENIRSFGHTGSFEGWIRKIMINTAIQKYRKNSRLFVVVSMEDHHTNLNHYYTDDILDHLGAKELLEMIQRLPPKYQMVFNLYVFERLKHREIAKLLGISEGTSKSNLSDARGILQRAVNKSRKIVELA